MTKKRGEKLNKVENIKQQDTKENCVAVYVMESVVEDYVKFNLFHNLHKKIGMILTTSLLLILVGVTLSTQGDIGTAIVFSAVGVLFPILLIGFQRVAVKSKLSNDFDFKNTVNTYEFYDDEIKNINKCGKRRVPTTTKYRDIMEVYETETAYYMYLDNTSSYIIRKNSLVQGDDSKLSPLLSGKVRKFHKNKNKNAK